MIHKDLYNNWKHSKFLCINEKEYGASRMSFIDKEIVNISDRIPYEDFLSKPRINMLLLPTFVGQNIDAMVNILPQMKTLLFITDQRWVSKQNRARAEEVIKYNYPNIDLVCVTAGEESNDKLINRLQNIDSKTGILYDSWFQKHSETGSEIINTNIFKIIGSLSSKPIFSLRASTLPNKGLIGGYVASKEDIKQAIQNSLESILFSDNSDNINITVPATAIFDYQGILSFGLPLDKFPEDSILYGKPLSFYQKYKIYIMLGIIIFLTLIFIFFIKVFKRN